MEPDACQSCRVCGSPISLEAQKCPICRSHQKKWRDNLAFFSSISSAIAIVAAGATFIFQAAISYYRENSHKSDASLFYLQTGVVPHAIISIANTGNDPIFVTDFTIKYEKIANITYPINKRIISGEVTNFNSDVLGALKGDRGFLALKSPIDQKYVQAIRQYSQIPSPPIGLECFHRYFFDIENSNVERMRDRYKKIDETLIEFDADGFINYFNAETGHQFKKRIKIISVVTRLNSTGCEAESVKEQLNRNAVSQNTQSSKTT